MPATYGLERFSGFDNNIGVAAVPTIGNPVQVNLQQLLSTDMVDSFDFQFIFKGTTNGYTGTENLSPFFPYNFVQSLTVPYQSDALNIGALDGALWHMVWVLRKGNTKYQTPTWLADQQPVLSDGYDPTAQPSSGSYTIATSTAETYQFVLSIPTCLWFDRFYDLMTDSSGKSSPGVIDDVYVSPLLMSSTGRNITPNLQLNPLSGTTVDQSPFVHSGTNTTPLTWTDGGSTVTIKRRGWRQPGGGMPMPPIFPWAYNWTKTRVPIGSATVTFQFPNRGQLLCVVIRLFDPTLASGLGDVIPLANLQANGGGAVLSYGAGITKFNDSGLDITRRIYRQHGVILPEGHIVWDMYIETRSNMPGEVINTYNTAGVQVSLNFGTNTPGAGSYMDVASEWLTVVR